MSFSIERVRKIIRAIQLLVGALDNDAQGLRAGAVKYPPGVRIASRQQRSLFVVPLEDADCTVAAKNLDKLSLYLDRYQAQYSNVVESLEFLSTEIDPEKSTAVITITSGISDGFKEDKDSPRYPPNAIQAATSMNHFSDAKQVRFLAIGDATYIPRDVLANFDEELDALSNNVPGNKRKISNIDDRGLIDEILSFLQESNILCKEQVEEIQRILSEQDNTDLERYITCIQNDLVFQGLSYNHRNLPQCYTDDTCTQNTPAHVNASDSHSLESEIIQAVEQVLSERGMGQQ